MTIADRQRALSNTLTDVRQRTTDIDFKSFVTDDGDRSIRLHQMYSVDKFLLSLVCLIFFFIGAPLGAIIRKSNCWTVPVRNLIRSW